LGALLGGAGYVLFSFQQASYVSALTGGTIEIMFGIFMLIRLKKIRK
jgi:hypothetical protein